MTTFHKKALATGISVSVALAGFIGAAAAQQFGGASTQQKGDTYEWSITISLDAPHHSACYDHARNGVASYDAVEDCDKALETETLSPRKTVAAHVNRGVIYYNLGEYEAALEDFTHALDLDVHAHAKTLVNRGLTYEALSYDALAKADYKAALAIRPNNQTALRRLEQLDKPLYERTRIPKTITAESPAAATGV